MDAESAKAAAKKVISVCSCEIRTAAQLSSMQAESLYVKIGYPTTPNTTDARALNLYYSRLQIDNDFFANGLRQR
jgi:hypothetical protein